MNIRKDYETGKHRNKVTFIIEKNTLEHTQETKTLLTQFRSINLKIIQSYPNQNSHLIISRQRRNTGIPQIRRNQEMSGWDSILKLYDNPIFGPQYFKDLNRLIHTMTQICQIGKRYGFHITFTNKSNDQILVLMDSIQNILVIKIAAGLSDKETITMTRGEVRTWINRRIRETKQIKQMEDQTQIQLEEDWEWYKDKITTERNRVDQLRQELQQAIKTGNLYNKGKVKEVEDILPLGNSTNKEHKKLKLKYKTMLRQYMMEIRNIKHLSVRREWYEEAIGKRTWLIHNVKLSITLLKKIEIMLPILRKAKHDLQIIEHKRKTKRYPAYKGNLKIEIQ